MLPPSTPPNSVCLLRLSAIGDTCHVVPLLRTLQHAWPNTHFTWVIGRAEAKLMGLLPEIEFITLNKRAGLSGLRQFKNIMSGRHFDILLHLQLSLRASLLAWQIPARIKPGFDRARASEGQWLFTNAQINVRTREHVLDSFMGFATSLGISEARYEWALPLSEAALQYAAQLIPSTVDAPISSQLSKYLLPTLIISPCSSHVMRNWRPERYAAVAVHAITEHGMSVILTGGPGDIERNMASAILAACPIEHRKHIINQVGKDTLPEMLALLSRARVLIAPDTGPAHMATLVGTPVIGLYAATNPARSGPYHSRAWCIDAFGRAAAKFLNSTPEHLPWVCKIEQVGVMDLITVQEVCHQLDRLLKYKP